MNSYCFQRSVNLKEVHQSLNLLLLPKDIVEFRAEDNCLDLIISIDRAKLFEKYLAKRYDLKKTAGGTSTSALSEIGCRLDLKTTLSADIAKKNSVSIVEMLLGSDFPSEFEAGDEKLKVTCHLLGIESANLIFSYAEKDKTKVSTQFLVKKGEWLNIASVKRDLAEKNKTLGIPQTEDSQSVGKIETLYELQFK